MRVTLAEKDYHHIIHGYRAETLDPKVIGEYLQANLPAEVTPVGEARKRKPKPAAGGAVAAGGALDAGGALNALMRDLNLQLAGVDGFEIVPAKVLSDDEASDEDVEIKSDIDVVGAAINESLKLADDKEA